MDKLGRFGSGWVMSLIIKRPSLFAVGFSMYVLETACCQHIHQSWIWCSVLSVISVLEVDDSPWALLICYYGITFVYYIGLSVHCHKYLFKGTCLGQKKFVFSLGAQHWMMNFAPSSATRSFSPSSIDFLFGIGKKYFQWGGRSEKQKLTNRREPNIWEKMRGKQWGWRNDNWSKSISSIDASPKDLYQIAILARDRSNSLPWNALFTH